MRGLEEFQPAELHEGDVAPGELDLQRRAVLRGAEQHCLRLQRDTGLASRQHRLDDERGLLGLVAHAHQLGPLARLALAPQRLGVALGSPGDHAVGGGEDGLGRAVVALQRDDARGRRELLGEVEDVPDRRAAEGVDRLRVVADHGHAGAVGLQGQHDARLQRVGVLVFVDQDVVEARADLGSERGHLRHLRPVEQEVVVVEHVLRLLRLDVGAEQALEIVLEVEAPRIARLQHVGERRQRVDRRRVDRKAGVLAREALAGLGEPQFVPYQVQEVGRVLAVVDGERRIEADARRVFAQQARADAVEGARPGELRPREPRAARRDLAHDALGAPRHLIRRAARERQQEDRAGVGALGDEVRDPVREDVGLARSRASDHQERPGGGVCHAVLDGGALLGVEAGEIGVGVGRRLEGGIC